MKRRKVSVSLSVAAFLIVLAQTDTYAQEQQQQQAAKKKAGSRQIVTGRNRAVPTRTARRSRTERRISRMRERARQVEPLIMAAALKYQVDPVAIWVIAYNETRFRWWLVSPKNARGMMQFIPGTAKDYGLADPFHVPSAIDAAARYVRNSARQFDNRLDLILASYNAGPGAVEAYRTGTRIVLKDGKVINPRGLRTGGVPPYTETRRYVAQGLKVYQRVRNAAVFPNQMLAQTRLTALPDTPQVRNLVAGFQLNDRELDELGGSQSPMILAGLKEPEKMVAAGVISPKGRALPARNGQGARSVEASQLQSPATSEEVFFDVHSGIRYLVRGGEIVQAIERIRPEASSPVENPGRNSGTNRAVVAKSSYYGSPGE